MSPEASAITLGPQATDGERARRQGLRIAVAVAVSFTVAVAQGDIIPFLGPLLAAQFLTSSRRPMGPAQAIGFVIVLIVAGQAFVLLTGLFGDRPLPFLLLIGLIYFACFFTQASGRGGPIPSLILTIGVAVPLLGLLHQDLGVSISWLLAKAALNGVIVAWLAHAAFPDVGSDPERAASTPGSSSAATRIASANTVILLGSVALCLVRSGLSTAIVLPLTVASLLNQLDLVTSKRTIVGLTLVNLLGGIVASVAFAVLELRPELLFLFLIVLVVSLLFGGAAAADAKTGKLYAGALAIFLILFGTGVSPLPSTSPEAFSTRIGYLLAAILYAITMAALLWPSRPSEPEGATS